MLCKDCSYCNDKIYCRITNRNVGVLIKGCSLDTDKQVKDMSICFTCRYWIGGGDWGISCAKNYYYANNNGFHEACELYEKKDEVKNV